MQSTNIRSKIQLNWSIFVQNARPKRSSNVMIFMCASAVLRSGGNHEIYDKNINNNHVTAIIGGGWNNRIY